MHPSTTHQIALHNQRRILDQAAADRLARLATAGRPSRLTRLVLAARRGLRSDRPATTGHTEPRSATTGHA